MVSLYLGQLALEMGKLGSIMKFFIDHFPLGSYNSEWTLIHITIGQFNERRGKEE